MIKKFQTKSIRWVLFVIYGILLIVNIGTYFVMYSQSIAAQKEEIDNSRINQMRLLKNDADSILSENIEFANFASGNYYVNLLKKTDYTSGPTAFNAYLLALREDINDYSSNRNIEARRYIYFPKIDMVVTGESIMKPKSFYTVNCGDKNVSYEDWLELITTHCSIPRNFVGMRAGAAAESLMSVTTVYDNRHELSYSVISFTDKINMDNILRRYKDSMPGEIRFIGADGETLFSMGETTDYHPDRTKMEESEGIRHLGTAKTSYVWIKSDIGGLVFTNIMPMRYYYMRLKKQEIVLVFWLMFMALLGGFLYYISYKYQYKNLKAIMNELDIESDAENEFSLIRNSIRNMSEDRKKLRKYLDLTGDITRETIFCKLSQGLLNVTRFSREQFAAFDILLDEPYFAIAALKEAKNELSHKQRKSAKNVLEELQQQLLVSMEAYCAQSYCYEYDGCLYTLFNLREGEIDEFQKVCVEELDMMVRKTNQEEETGVFAAVSDIHKSEYAIRNCADDVSAVLEYSYIASDYEMRTRQMMDRHMSAVTEYEYTKEDEQKIIDAVMSGERTVAIHTFETVFDKCTRNTPQSFLIMRCVIFDFLETLIKTEQTINGEADGGYKERFMEKTMNLNTFSSIREALREEVLLLCDQVEAKDDFVEQINNYIEENYHNSELSLKLIAEALDMNPVYVSNTYKRKTGDGILMKITALRMEKANRLLLEEKLSVSETAKRVGYAYSQTFSRTFKKYFGVKPTEVK